MTTEQMRQKGAEARKAAKGIATKVASGSRSRRTETVGATDERTVQRSQPVEERSKVSTWNGREY